MFVIQIKSQNSEREKATVEVQRVLRGFFPNVRRCEPQSIATDSLLSAGCHTFGHGKELDRVCVPALADAEAGDDGQRRGRAEDDRAGDNKHTHTRAVLSCSPLLAAL